jgi:inositol-hexakisphosphate kinase
MGPREVDDDPEFGDQSSQDQLPHVPLRPFRNQVGGHSTIYKFTKGAVCKVRLRYSSMVVFSHYFFL